MIRKSLMTLILLAVSLMGTTWQTEVCKHNRLALFPLIVPDQKSDGGAICCWIDQREDHYEVYAKEIRGDSGGTASGWDTTGNEVSRPPSGFTPHGHRLSHTATYGDSGEIIIAYTNHHRLEAGGEVYEPGIYAQKMKDGSPQWYKWGSENKIGVEITTASKNPPAIGPCDGGCVIVALMKDKKTIRAWKLDEDGDFVGGEWGGAGGEPIREGTTLAKSPKIVPTPDNGVWVEGISKNILTSRDNLLSLIKEEL